MYVIDKKGAEYTGDEGLKRRAAELMQMECFKDLICHVNLDQVVFLRFSGAKVNWHGKCQYIGKAPLNIIPQYIIHMLSNFGLLDLNQITGDVAELFDIRFIITLNDDSISMAGGDIQRMEDGVLVHELMHIHPTGDKLVKHDIEDFKDLVQQFGPYWTEGIFREEGDETEFTVPELISATPEYVTPEESN